MIQGGRSGVGRYVIALSETLIKRGLELHLAGLDADRSHFPMIPDEHWVSIPASFDSGAKNLLWHQASLPGIIRHNGYDVVHIPSYRRMVINCPAPQVATIHDCAPFIMAEKYDALRGFFGRKVVPWIARRMDRVIAVSATAGKDIQHYLGVTPERLTLIPNGIDHARFQPASENALADFRTRRALTKPYLIYIARFEHPAKNHVRLIEAFGRFREESGLDWQLVLGGAPWHGKEVIDEAWQSSTHRDAIRMEGFVEDDELALWYGAAEALVFPSLMEGFGFPVIEAQACGTLAVSSNATSLAEVNGPAALPFDPTSVDSITAALHQLGQMDTAERTRRIAQGIEWAAQYRWEKHAEQCEQVYREVAGG
ncbi:glycosyltransferase family 4 protein [Cerasicoccus fimbriatus]|uniref:glycosyltransferase family 4 protein n=1 Tax=Cerasicoccus fimbriatus TaxID=3014554 RepID=UPI0022B46C6B|nr:glycosyltransferase family 1 protein [Cerasicoccus sp. TK19100]